MGGVGQILTLVIAYSYRGFSPMLLGTVDLVPLGLWSRALALSAQRENRVLFSALSLITKPTRYLRSTRRLDRSLAFGG